ncbi:LuxR C-terminal-related transcriptional regulator [Jannaschia sp. CCS1]|uniref:LuxR C-terminal-related transcriptional regulator n=1 Tax=Jannaschia sp. (strain CCS1) TaxID=290400 RepID=UPI000053A0BF|nr:LuxR C-terminal-related transcriptional regulator [Jannaschia sp. CCS1]ABD56311.1 transcriptional regulator, LuxR family [Jannaschia sp. CCS1]
MVRRIAQNETFHGTAAGQAPNVADLAHTFNLSERQAQCVALLRMGTPVQGVAEVLSISTSTLEKHLADLRRTFAVETTTALVRAVTELIPDDQLDAFHCWPSATNAMLPGGATDRTFAARLRTSTSVEQALAAVKETLSEVGAQHVYYCFLPHSVQGFLRGDIIDAFLAPPQIEAAFRANNGLAGQPAALSLFNAPVSVPSVALDPMGQPPTLAAFYRACQDDGARHMMVLGFPAGPGFVGMAITLSAADDPSARIADMAEDIRATAMAMHGAVLTNGTLAARVRLTVRERDAVSALARGDRAADAARSMKISERAFAKLLASARGKLNARTNAEAVGKAAIINALVFL